MRYSALIRSGIKKKGYSLTQICFQLAKRDIWLDRAALSKLQNGKMPPAKDTINIALAEVLDIDPKQLRVAAVKETLSEDLFELIRAVN